MGYPLRQEGVVNSFRGDVGERNCLRPMVEGIHTHMWVGLTLRLR